MNIFRSTPRLFSLAFFNACNKELYYARILFIEWFFQVSQWSIMFTKILAYFLETTLEELPISSKHSCVIICKSRRMDDNFNVWDNYYSHQPRIIIQQIKISKFVYLVSSQSFDRQINWLGSFQFTRSHLPASILSPPRVEQQQLQQECTRARARARKWATTT